MSTDVLLFQYQNTRMATWCRQYIKAYANKGPFGAKFYLEDTVPEQVQEAVLAACTEYLERGL